MNKHPFALSPRADISRFREDGAICIREVFDSEWVARMNGAVERLSAIRASVRARQPRMAIRADFT